MSQAGSRTNGNPPRWRNVAASVKQRLELGARVDDFFRLNEDLGSRRWKVVIETHLGLKWSNAIRMRVKRALDEYATHGDGGGAHILGIWWLVPGWCPREAAHTVQAPCCPPP